MTRDDMTNDHEAERHEVELMLPWYVNGTLDEADVLRVEALLARDSDLAAQLATIQEDQHEAAVANEALTPSPRSLDNLMAEIEAEAPPRLVKTSSPGNLFSALEDLLQSLTPGRLAFGALAAALLIMLQAGTIGVMMLPTPGAGPTYVTASGSKDESGTVYLIRFKSEVSLSRISEFLKDNDAQIIAGPKAGNMFRVRVGAETLKGDARDKQLAKLRAQKSLIADIFPTE